MPVLFAGLAVLAGAVSTSLAARYGYRGADTVCGLGLRVQPFRAAGERVSARHHLNGGWSLTALSGFELIRSYAGRAAIAFDPVADEVAERHHQ